MEVQINKLRNSVQTFLQFTQDNHEENNVFITNLQKFLDKPEYGEKDIGQLFKTLGEHFLISEYTLPLAISFEEQLLLLLSLSLRCDDEKPNVELYQSECIALAKLLKFSTDAKRFAKTFFRNKPAPFEKFSSSNHNTPNKKNKLQPNGIPDVIDINLPLLKCCYQLLKSDSTFFRDLWDWSEFITNYVHSNKESSISLLYCNHIMAILTNMSGAKLHSLNTKIPMDIKLQFERETTSTTLLATTLAIKSFLPNRDDNQKTLTIPLRGGGKVTNIEGVLLSIFNKENEEFYAKTDGSYDRIVKVDSTVVNLRSIALGIAASKPICLSGPVGCGKTTLIEYLARKSGRICPKPKEIEIHQKSVIKAPEDEELLIPKKRGAEKKKVGNKRKHMEDMEDLLNLDLPEDQQKRNGFLRIQLGDQTDSKMLLGQYRCTDVPGEFIWLPGVLTQAVMNGYWLLLEDLDAATQDTYTILSSLLERSYLSVPGFSDCVKIEPGFQLFVTVRTNKSATNSNQKSLFALLEKYLYTINILPLSRNELCKVVSTNYPKLSTVANRIVDVFLTFSSGDHTSADNLRQQETRDKADTTEQYVALPFEQITTSSIPNSGRLVSTRDLIKLCQRSNPQFSVTSAECAYFVFQNAVDVFCSYLPQTKEKTAIISSIGAKLGIIRSRCEHFANEHKPDVKITNDSIKIGRATLIAKSLPDIIEHADEDYKDLMHVQKRQKLSLQNERQLLKVSVKSTFSFTRLASCLMERIAVSVAHAEPVLLVGETGVGKTSSVQYLAERTNHKLVVVNMNNQSDVSDLIGGFKPVELNYVLAPLRYEFERLFCETFKAEKNQDFLTIFATHFNKGRNMVIIKTMLNLCTVVLNKNEQTIIPLLPRWQALQIKLQKLQIQLDKSINISFAFIPGSLVNCIKNGDWVLLDEINLASAETLECLSTILEPDGSVVLLERGDFMPVKRHPDFQIFACMNPSTDIGKKDLPVGIRNRFTEFFVDELTTDADLSLLVGDYLSSTGIQRKSVHNIVQLYKSLKRLAELQLNDGLGNRPVYSLRTLCRSLRICAKNLCGSIERNLYESFCLSFLTQLDTESHQVVLLLIKDALLRDAKAILMQSLPQLGENFLQFEGYWIQRGTLEMQECVHYILTDSVKLNLKDLARIISIGKLPILLQGPTSAGKTSLIEYVAKRSGNRCLRINNHEHTDLQEYIGTYAADCTGKLSFQEGVLVQAMRHGYWIILDELNLASTDILEALNRVLDDNRELFIAETQTLVKAHPNFMLFATQNPPGLYGGRKTLSRAFKNRFIELHFADIPRAELEIILEKRCLIPASYAKKMVHCMSDLQKNRKTTSKNVFTLRDLFRWGNRYTHADKALSANSSYDWNQHLIEEGYLVLSAKVRTSDEITIIEETLYRNFRKKVDTKLLFDVTTSEQLISPVTRKILLSIKNFKQRSDIVWTRNMTRMAVLTAKALQFDEPVLLVGPTGCGKTTVCQLLASIDNVKLRILNCHMHTEGGDFLGGLRPCRGINAEQKLFEWADGPLIYAMHEGSYFMADEISLAEDSVLERLNCILEPERTVLLAEKGGIGDDVDDASKSDSFVVKAAAGFQFLATMNPGGDFGKKELSPALRNRFTEIWCLPSDNKVDLVEIAYNCMKNEGNSDIKLHKIAEFLVEVVLYLRESNEKFKFSIRDILAWAKYMVNNAHLSFAEQAIYGLETIFLDALEMLPFESLEQVEKLKTNVKHYALITARTTLEEHFELKANVEQKRGQKVLLTEKEFGIHPFFIDINESRIVKASEEFLFDAPTTKQNLFRLLSALTLQKPVLLEGPPGVGKTSIVESIARAIGYQIVRINLCEHTDLADLFGTDLPAEDNLFESNSEKSHLGSFVWRDGPLLAALKAPNTWILLDELNLAPQSVLEGLNAVLDHRGEVYIPELNKTFLLDKLTRIFACQNPLKQGGGRKGLPQSFLNRFTKVYLRKLTTDDLLHVINSKYSKYFEQLQDYFSQLINDQQGNLFELYNGIKLADVTDVRFNLAERLVRFSEHLDLGVSRMEFGYKGGPFEFNLRDILRWCDLLRDSQTTGYIMRKNDTLSEKLEFRNEFKKFLLILYERMKLVYYQRMRSETDKLYIRNAFANIFLCNAEELNELSDDVALYWTQDKVYLNDIVLERGQSNDSLLFVQSNQQEAPLLLSGQRQMLKNVVETVLMEKPVLLCGPTDSGKTKVVDALCILSNRLCNTDTIDDSVTGSFQQIDLNRHLEDISKDVQGLVFRAVQNCFLHETEEKTFEAQLWHAWSEYKILAKAKIDSHNTVNEELQVFKQRLNALDGIINIVEQTPKQCQDECFNELSKYKLLLKVLKKYAMSADSLNTGGSFEWVDSKIVKSLKTGQYIILEHVNLCSSAVLDRLNPLFEPGGSLLIAEKGITANDTAEVVTKSPDFRAFLTIDPRHGELSRAMRNRCIEISLNRDHAYTIDDMRAIIYHQGVKHIGAINCLLQIHQSITQLTDINQYSVSHLTQCAFLATSYKRIGYTTQHAIYVAAMEVYVYAATMDLLGYGLAYYQNKLRELVLAQTAEYDDDKSASETITNSVLSNVILSCDNLDTLTLIKLQAAPLQLLLQATSSDSVPIKELTALLQPMQELQQINQLNRTKLCHYYLCIFYEASSFDDLQMRHLYLQSWLCNNNYQVMLQLSEQFNLCLQTNSSKFNKALKNLPWNRKLLPRLRDYAKCGENAECRALALSASLIARLLLTEVPRRSLGKLHQLDALQYSQALVDKSVTEKFSNAFLENLSICLDHLHRCLYQELTEAKFQSSQYVKFVTKFLWFNRLLAIAQQKLLHNGELQVDVMNKLVLHFHWLSKHLLSDLNNSCLTLSDSLQLSVAKLSEYVVESKRPLNVSSKIYTKLFVQFQPYYQQQQVKLYEVLHELQEIFRIVPQYGSSDKTEITLKLLALKSEEMTKWRAFLREKIPGCSFKPIMDITLDTNDPMDIDVDTSSLISLLTTQSVEKAVFLKPYELLLDVLREYFISRVVGKEKVNSLFSEELLTLNGDLWTCLNTIGNAAHNNIATVWQELRKEMRRKDDVRCVDDLSNFKNLRSYQRQLRNALQCYQLNNLAVRSDCVPLNGGPIECEIDSRLCYEGPALTNVLLALIFKQDGNLKPVPLNELDSWRNCLQSTRQLLWHNASILMNDYSTNWTNLEQATENAENLLYELKVVAKLKNSEEQIDATFKQCIDELHQQLVKLQSNVTCDSKIEPLLMAFDTAWSNALIGALELCLLTHMPLIDPVEKNRLKTLYIAEDLDNLAHLLTAYDFMKIVMNYKHFGHEIYTEIKHQLDARKQQQQQLSQKVALRPELCLYASLVQEVIHFVQSNCDLKTLFNLIMTIRNDWQGFTQQDHLATGQQMKSSAETLSKIELWLANAQRFVHHTLTRFAAYYQDFVQPIQCAVNQMRFGLEQLKIVFAQVQQTGSVQNAQKLRTTLDNIIQFPSVQPLIIKSSDVYGLLAELPHGEHEYFRLLKAKLCEMRNCISLASVIDGTSFDMYDFALGICNQTWQKEEERRRQQRAEAESLYVTKTRGGIENEELEELQEIETNFPTSVEEDFAEFAMQQQTLEQVLKLDKKSNLKEKLAQIVGEEDYAFLARNFIEVMTLYTDVYYRQCHRPKATQAIQLKLLEAYQSRLHVFVKLYAHQRTALNETFDESTFNSLAFALAMQQRALNDINMEDGNELNNGAYNFYKHSNITEILGCTDLLSRIETRTREQLELYPEHAGLADINLVIARIRNLPATASVVRFNTGFQLLRQKLALWNEVAHRQNNLVGEETEVAEYVQRWTKLELQHWRNCLTQTSEQVENQAYRYWFFIYNLLQQFIEQREVDNSYTDVKFMERRFAKDEILDASDLGVKNKVQVTDLIRILREFIEASCYGDFHVRLQLLQAFEMYLHNVNKLKAQPENLELQSLISGLYNLQLYFAQFSNEVKEINSSRRAPIEKKLREFVKIQSYIKDLSYFSMRNNVASVHRNLNKFLKEFRLLLQQKITEVFQPKDATVKDYQFNNDKGKLLRHYNKMKYAMCDVHNFVANDKLRQKYNLKDSCELMGENALLQRLGKHFNTSRSIVKESLGNASYPDLINALDELLEVQLEHCEYLRNLNVDRTKERPKQKLEAKQILQQKRKALSDLFKTLARLGVSYKSGLMELTLRNEFENFQLPPFCIKAMRMHPNAIPLSENIELYYMKCVFKLKLLQNIMLTPLSELGPPNIERIKGFSVDMFLLVQRQREQLANATRELYELRGSLQNLRNIAEIVLPLEASAEWVNFGQSCEICATLKSKLCRIYYTVHQFELLLACAPAQENNNNVVLANQLEVQSIQLIQTSPYFNALLESCKSILITTKSLLTDLNKHNIDYLCGKVLQSFVERYQQIIIDLRKIINLLTASNGKQLPTVKSLLELLITLEDNQMNNLESVALKSIDLDNVNTELANITHNVLLALEKIYKRHPKIEAIGDEVQTGELQEQHLKQKLSFELENDWQMLNIQRIIGKLSNVLVVLKHGEPTEDKLICLRRAVALLPVLEQYQLLADYLLLQQLATHKVSAKMLSVMLTVFVEIGTKGFCVPPDLMQDEEDGKSKQESKNGEGFGLEDGTGENDASDKIESEDQLDDAKRPEDRKNDENKEEPDCKEEKGIDMSDDFDAKMQDVEKPENEEDDSGESEDDEELNKEMGETEEGAEKLDEQIWGDDEEKPEQDEEEEMNEEDNGKGTTDEKDSHNDLDTKNDAAKQDGNDEHEKDGLDATNEPNQEDKRKQEAKDIDNMKDPEMDDEQTNPYHNELEEPPEPEEMDLGDMNNVDENHDEGEEHGDDNPFDIDTMKENMQQTEQEDPTGDDDDNDNVDEQKEDKGGSDGSDSEAEEAGTEPEPTKSTNDKDEEEANKDEEPNEDEAENQTRGDLETEEEKPEPEEQPEESRQEKPEQHSQSKDKSSKEDNVQSVPETEQSSSADQVENQQDDVKQDQKLDEQETGEEKDGVGQAENETNDGGHQGIADTKENVTKEESKKQPQTQEKRKQGRTNEERTLGDAEENKLKQLKTIDNIKEPKQNEEGENENKEEPLSEETEEYQHVKEPKSSDKTTLDNATEEQSKQIQHQDDEEKKKDDDNENEENADELMDADDQTAQDDSNENQLEQLSSEKYEQKSEKPSKTEKVKERLETVEEMEIEGEVVPTMTVPRSAETTAHSNMELILDKSVNAEELTTAEQINLRQMYQQQLTTPQGILPQHDDHEVWQSISNRMTQNARELCEQLRLILEPTKCTRLKGDYRTGRRINMKKIIPYIASQFRKDKIWLRRTKPAQRDYKITIAIDDSKSMHHNNSKTLTLEAISLVSQALTLLESGRLSIVSFGEAPKIILNHTEQLDGPKLVGALNFAQDKTKIAGLLDFIRIVNTEEGALGADNGLFENLLLILSDGRNIFSEGNAKVKNAIKLARLQRIFLVYIIIDNPDNKNSILDIQNVEVKSDGMVNITSYLDNFPFPYYVIVRDLNQLPLVLSDAMRQWFELVNSEQ